jgi:hypothetical protein
LPPPSEDSLSVEVNRATLQHFTPNPLAALSGLHRTQVAIWGQTFTNGHARKFLDRLLDKEPDQDAHSDQDDREGEQLIWSIHA